jgi:hypothetical protein
LCWLLAQQLFLLLFNACYLLAVGVSCC